MQAFATFTVENPAHPLVAQDVTSTALLTTLGFRVDRNTGFFDQTLELSTASAAPIIGPLYLVRVMPVGRPVTTIAHGHHRRSKAGR